MIFSLKIKYIQKNNIFYLIIIKNQIRLKNINKYFLKYKLMNKNKKLMFPIKLKLYKKIKVM